MKQTKCAHCLTEAKLHKTYVRSVLGEKKEREYMLCMDCSLAFKRGETPIIEPASQPGPASNSKKPTLDELDGILPKHGRINY